MKILIIKEGVGIIETPKNFIVPAKKDLVMLDSGYYTVESIEYNYPRNEIIVLMY